MRDYVKKGSKLYVEGKIQTRSWDDQTSGEKKYRTEIVVRQISLLSGNGQQNGDGSSNDNQRSRQSSGSVRAGHEDYGETGITDDDIPF